MMLFHIDTLSPQTEPSTADSPYYQVILLPGPAAFTVDFTHYRNSASAVLFLSPYQHLSWTKTSDTVATRILFHGDFYCIEFHKAEVACNGLLFNNIYLQPFVCVDKRVFGEIKLIIRNMRRELSADAPFTESVVRAYLQLILALCSKAKKQFIDSGALADTVEGPEGPAFQQLLEDHFTVNRSTQFYAGKLNLSLSTFGRKIKRQLGKSPSTLIQDRVILESKKQLHLTYLSVKEIATKLGFDDEHYFSRYFKKHVGISPSKFREQVGISIVAQRNP